jgi:hypothetical protein
VLSIVTLPPPDCDTPLIVRADVVFVRLTLPEVVLVALNPVTVFAPLSVVPVAEDVVNVPAETAPEPVSLIDPVVLMLRAGFAPPDTEFWITTEVPVWLSMIEAEPAVRQATNVTSDVLRFAVALEAVNVQALGVTLLVAEVETVMFA